jgi:hypothetical protein
MRIDPDQLTAQGDRFDNLARRSLRIRIKNGNKLSLEWLCSVTLDHRDLRGLSIHTAKPMTPEEAGCIARILQFDLPQLRELTLGTDGDGVPDAEAIRVVSEALASTQCPIRELDMREIKVGLVTAELLVDALLRGPVTLRSLNLSDTDFKTSIHEAVSRLVQENTRISKLRIPRLYSDVIAPAAGPHPLQSFVEILGSNRVLKSLNFNVGGAEAHTIFSALRSNDTLRSLRIHWCAIHPRHLPFIVECLCQNRRLQKLVLSVSSADDGIGTALCTLLEQNTSLKKLNFTIDNGSTADLSTLLPGLAKNSTLRELKISYPDHNFIEKLADCLLSTHGTEFARLERMDIEYSSVDGNAASKLADAVISLPNLKNLDLFVVEAGPTSAPAFARMIEGSTSLEVLGLYGANLGDEGLILVCEALKKSLSLREVALGGATHGDAALLAVCEMIYSCKSLQFLDFSGTAIPHRLKPLFEDAVLRNMNMSRCELCFHHYETSPEAEEESMDLKQELIKRS